MDIIGFFRKNKKKNDVQGVFSISVKFRRVAIIYSVAAIFVLGGLAASCSYRLSLYRMAADYSSAAAFDETVSAVGELSLSLKKLGYVTDDTLGRSICSKAYAEAMSAEAAMSVLPFSTHELEKLSGFLNLAGDYTASLLAQASDDLSQEQKQQLRQLSDTAAEFSSRMSQLQNEINDGTLLMDNIMDTVSKYGGSGGEALLSARMLSYEEEFSSPEEFVYDGKYSPRPEAQPGGLSEEEAKELAARAAGVEPRELKEEYSYEGPDGRKCYSAGELLLCVSSRGLESMSQSRLIGSGGVSAEEAQGKAEEFLQALGYEDMALSGEKLSETLAVYSFAPQQDGALRTDEYISLSVALDDGSIYAFDATRMGGEMPELNWKVDEDSAKASLPEGVETDGLRRVIIKSPGGNYLPCWELNCPDESGGTMCVYVNAETGKQCKIEYRL